MATKRGKKCGNSHIPKGHKCSKGQAESASLDRKKVAKLAAMTGLAVVGGVVAYKVFKNKITDQEADSIISEAVKGGKKWGPFEALKRRNQGRCDAKTVSRCRRGGGSYGDYYVHTSEKYGVKVMKEKEDWTPPGETSRVGKLVAYESTIQDLANKTGANVPAVLAIRSNKVVMEHLKDYQEAANFGNGRNVAGRDLPIEAREDFIKSMKALHTAGIAHGDLHDSNVMMNPKTKKMAIIDWGYATAVGQGDNPTNGRSPLQNLQRELNQMPYHLGLNTTIEVPKNFPRLNEKSREIAIKNLYTRVEREFAKANGTFVPRSRLISNNAIAMQQSFELSPNSVKAAQGAFKGNKTPEPGTSTLAFARAGLGNLTPATGPLKPPKPPVKAKRNKTQTFVRKALAEKLINNNLSNLEPDQIKLLQAKAGRLKGRDFKSQVEFAVRANKPLVPAKPTGTVTNMERRVNAIVATGFDAKNKPSRTPGGQHRIKWSSATRRWAQAERKSLQAGTTPPIAEVKTWKPPGTDTINRDRVRLGLPELSAGFIRKYRRTTGGGKVRSSDRTPPVG
jgi:predicted Ser/Thr protein kinase